MLSLSASCEACGCYPGGSCSLSRFFRLARQDQIQRAPRPRQYLRRCLCLRRVATAEDLACRCLQLMQRFSQIRAGGPIGKL